MTVGGRLGFALLALAAAFSWWLKVNQTTVRRTAPARNGPQPGYYLTGARLEQTDDTGRPYLRIAAATARQDPATQTVKLDGVAMDYTASGAAPWLLTATRGVLERDAHHLTLSGEVTVTGLPVARADPAVIRTDWLALDTDTSLATTPRPVHIVLGQHELSATGLRADLKRDHVSLESAVHGHYTP